MSDARGNRIKNRINFHNIFHWHTFNCRSEFIHFDLCAKFTHFHLCVLWISCKFMCKYLRVSMCMRMWKSAKLFLHMKSIQHIISIGCQSTEHKWKLKSFGKWQTLKNWMVKLPSLTLSSPSPSHRVTIAKWRHAVPSSFSFRNGFTDATFVSHLALRLIYDKCAINANGSEFISLSLCLTNEMLKNWYELPFFDRSTIE